jgi:uncharacterized protein YegL
MKTLALGFAAWVAVAVAACGGSGGDSEFGRGGNGDGTGGEGDPSGDGFFPGGGDGNGNGGGNVNAQCASTTAQAELVPVRLVFMYDRSGSMAQNSKWDSCKTGMSQFFADPKSGGIQASLAFFTYNNNSDCNVGNYKTPSVSMRALPDANAFSSAINNQTPNGGTPTRPALIGAIQYAQEQLAQNPGNKVAVVLVTDGEPNDCQSSVSSVAAEAQKVAQTIPTYVVGVGNSLSNLNQIAAAGGTQKAFIVSTNNPAQTAADFQNALSVIRGQALACDLKMPTPPAGKELDINTVNVVYTPAGGQGQTLTYNGSCNGGTGWRYDDPAKPTKIVLCAQQCSQIQAAQGGKLELVTGCATKGGVTK